MAIRVRLTYEETEALREFAQRAGRSMQDVARAAIDTYITSRSRRRDEHLNVIIAEDSELLTRLRTS